MRKTLISLAALLGATHAAGATAPKIFIHYQKFGAMPCRTIGAGQAGCSLPRDVQVLLPHVAGAQISIPWSAVQNSSASQYDWSQVENVIRPWAAAGKQVALTFHSVDEAVGANGTPLPATPAFLLNPPAGTPGPRLVACHGVANGQSYAMPVVPVYWDPLFSTPWKAFAATAIAHFAHRPEIAYLRFGEGEGDEAMIEVQTTAAVQNPSPTSIAACNSLWTQADTEVGHQGVFNDMVAYTTSLVAYLGHVAATTPGAPPLTGSYNDMGNFEKGQSPQPSPYADRLAAAEAQAGLAPGNEGFGAQTYGSSHCSSKFGGIYGWTDAWFAQNHVARPAAMYMQTSSPEGQGYNYTIIPCFMQQAMAWHVPYWEMYEKALLAAFDPANASGQNPYTGTSPSRTCLAAQVAAVLQSQPIPSCH
jgi:hypothetical protein